MSFDPAAFVTALEQRARRDGARPLITYYDVVTGERTELSGATFANWVDKTVNLADELGAASGSRVALPLLLGHPGHWVSLVWLAAVWQLGGVVTLDTADAELAVIGPERPAPHPGVETVACSLHPFGLGFTTPLDGVTDYADVRMQPDVHLRYPGPGVGWDAETDPVTPRDTRALVVPGEPWVSVADALVAPVLGGGSSVVVVGGSEEDLTRIAATERVG